MQRRAAEESLTDHGKDNSNGRAHVGDAIRHKPGILGFLRQIGFMGATPEAVAAIRLLALTGCRRSEVLNLRWRDIGADAINLADSETGPRPVPLGKAARAHIDALPGARDPDGFVFPRYAEARRQSSLIACWRTVCADAKLGRLRLHDLRHTAASQAVMAGEHLPLVGEPLGHRRHRTTAGYAHLADAHVVEAAEKVGAVIAEAMATS